MSKEKNQVVKEAHFEALAPVDPVPAAAPAPVAPPPNPKLVDTDRLQLDLARANRKTALANAQKALAENEVAELNYKYLVLQIYMRYGLTDADAISETGEIVKGGALPNRLPVK